MNTRRRTFIASGLGAIAIAALAFLSAESPARAATQSGAAAPAFTAVDDTGRAHSLAQYRGKTVVLEWTNNGCPYVKKHYDTRNMQTLQREAAAQGVVWLSVISSAPGKQGHVTPEQSRALTQSRGAAPTAVLLDPDGALGRLYGARTTPHMFVITPTGVLAYQGAIDDRNSADHATVQGARNYVREALAAVAAGRAPAVAATQPYGCSVKYAS